MAGIRRTTAQMITDLEAEIKALKVKSKKKKDEGLFLTDKNDGMEQLLVSVVAVATTHKTTVAEVVKAIARIKKTGLKITKGVRKSKPKADK